MKTASAKFGFPEVRMRRNRAADWSRKLVAENRLSAEDLIWPVFIQEGVNKKTPINSMPGVFRMSPDVLVRELKSAEKLKIPAVALFPYIEQKLKSADAEEAINDDNLVCRTIKKIKKETENIGVICDVALDAYTTHGQDGLVIKGEVANDETVEVLSKQAISLAKAGCDIVAPSDMMDGRVGEIRKSLDKNNFKDVKILSYAAKYASNFYGPYRDAIGSAANLGKADKRTYQMDPANSDEAIREVMLDVYEGADMVMVKPGMPYLDVLKRVKDKFNIPVFAYQVSGEYSMIKAAAEKGWLDYNKAMYESLIAFKRAGATGVFTYAALEMAELLKEDYF